MGLYCSKKRKDNGDSDSGVDLEMGLMEKVQEGTVEKIGEEYVDKLEEVGEKCVQGEVEVGEVDEETRPLVLDDTAWDNIHGGPKTLILEHLRTTQEFPQWTKPTKGMLLFGPPGNT